ncbi:MAG: hypothetical protein IBX71_01385 [Candidatus Desulforudis sp.]|nr:hypothetical protein [Desulforudis sp.]
MQWEWQGLNLRIVLVALVAGLVLLLGGHWVYKSYGYHQPLIQALEENSAVESYEIDDSTSFLRVVVHLKRTENLMETYQQLSRRVEQSVGGRPFQLVVKDQRDAKLSQAYYQSQFAVHQAIVQGSFPEMAAVVDENAREAGAEARVFVDSDCVYLQLEGVNGHLLEVIPRNHYQDQAQSGGGGGLYVQRG